MDSGKNERTTFDEGLLCEEDVARWTGLGCCDGKNLNRSWRDVENGKGPDAVAGKTGADLRQVQITREEMIEKSDRHECKLEKNVAELTSE